MRKGPVGVDLVNRPLTGLGSPDYLIIFESLIGGIKGLY